MEFCYSFSDVEMLINAPCNFNKRPLGCTVQFHMVPLRFLGHGYSLFKASILKLLFTGAQMKCDALKN